MASSRRFSSLSLGYKAERELASLKKSGHGPVQPSGGPAKHLFGRSLEEASQHVHGRECSSRSPSARPQELGRGRFRRANLDQFFYEGHSFFDMKCVIAGPGPMPENGLPTKL